MQVMAIIYGAQSGSLRRIVVADNLVQLAAPSALETGEDAIICNPNDAAWVKRNGKQLPDLESCKRLVAEKTGKEPMAPRCVVLGGDLTVVSECLADPLIDQHKDGEIIREPEAVIGDKLLEDGKFYREIDGNLTEISKIIVPTEGTPIEELVA